MSDAATLTTGQDIPLGMDAIGTLAEALRGPVITPADPGYDEARMIWNGSADKRPKIIAQCVGALALARSLDDEALARTLLEACAKRATAELTGRSN